MELKQGEPIEKVDNNISYSTPTKSRLPFIILITLIVVIILGTSFYLGLNKVKQDTEPAASTQSQPTAFISPTPISAIDQTASWKTFTENQEVGFTIKYPPNWEFKQNTGRNNEQVLEFQGPEGIVNVIYGLYGVGGGCPDNIEKVLIDGGSLNMCHYLSSLNTPEQYTYFFKAKNSAASLAAYPSDENSRPQILQILSTFQFLDQSLVTPTIVVDETASWQTYSNTEFVFSFKYPGTFELEERQVTGNIGMNIELITVNPKVNFSIYELDYPDVSNWVFEHSGLGSSGIGYFPSARDIKASTKGNLQTVEFTDNIPGTSVETKSVVFSKNNKAYVFTLLDSANSILFTQILSTFKFTQ